MRLSFDTIEEILAFVERLKKSRPGKADKDDEAGTAPAPLAPPAGGPGPTFNPAMPSAFPAPAGPSPEVLALVQRIATRIDGAIVSGQPADQVLGWFRGQVGPEASAATMDQIKTVFLPKAAVPTLENIAKLMNA